MPGIEAFVESGRHQWRGLLARDAGQDDEPFASSLATENVRQRFDGNA